MQDLLAIGDRVSEVAVLGENYRDVDGLYRKVADAAGPEVETKPWNELDTYLGSMLAVMDGFVVIWIVVMLIYLLGDVLRIFSGDFQAGQMEGMQATQMMYLAWPP